VRGTPHESHPHFRWWRPALLALLLIPPNSFWIIEMERVRQGPYVTSISLLFNVIFLLLALTLLNALLARRFPRHAFSQPELLTLYSMLAIASALSGMDMMQGLLMVITNAAWFATPENRWDALFGDSLPRWLMITDRSVLQGYYLGHSSLYRPEVLRAWAGPVAWWMGFIIALIASADLSHIGARFGQPPPLSQAHLDLARRHDMALLEKARSGDADGLYQVLAEEQDRYHVCGFPAIYALLRALPIKEGRLLSYQQAAEPQTHSCVSFASVGLK